MLLLPRLRANSSAGGLAANAPDVRRGCWDVFGQLGWNYALQSAPHMAPLIEMIGAIVNGTGTSDDAAKASRTAVEAAAAQEEAAAAAGEETAGEEAAGEEAAGEEAAGPAEAEAEEGTQWAQGLLLHGAAAPLEQLHIDPRKIFSFGSSSGGDMAIQFQVGFSAHVSGVCGNDAQPFGCAATRFAGDFLLPQTRASSTPHCHGCPANTTIAYDHCKSHAGWVEPTLLASQATALPSCQPADEADGGAAAGRSDGDCIDALTHLRRARVFLTRGECRTYVGSAVENTLQVYKQLGAGDAAEGGGLLYFDRCRPDGGHVDNDTTPMCLSHMMPSLKPKGRAEWRHLHAFEQAPYAVRDDVGFGPRGLVYVPEACRDAAQPACGLQVRFHGCGGVYPPDPETMAFAETNGIVLLLPAIQGKAGGNNATAACNAGTAVAGNCKEISRGCWDGYGQLSDGYVLQSAAHMSSVWRMVARVANLSETA